MARSSTRCNFARSGCASKEAVPRAFYRAAAVVGLVQKQERKMSAKTPENVIIRAMHEAFIKYPEGDGGQNLDHQWIQPEQSSHVAKAIILELAANGFEIVKKGA